jgi:CheY-like chemotaxis protein
LQPLQGLARLQRLPLERATDQTVGRTTTAPRPAEAKVALLVDRDEDTRQMYAEFLEQCGWEITLAADGREALAKALAQRPSIVVTETRLPIVDGFELCERLKREPATASMPIIVVTADAYAPDVQRAREAGADVVLVKPCLPESLRVHLHQLLENTAAHRRTSASFKPPQSRRRLTPSSRPIAKAPAAVSSTTPPSTPPVLACPICRGSLTYDLSHIGASTSARRRPEQWDYYSCATGCGRFQYRHRTGGVRRV